MIAMGLLTRPHLLIADEPTTALDVTTEAQILDLLRELQEELGMSILYITHNLGVVAEMVEAAIVMYLGRVVEQADVIALFEDPKHPYLQALLRSIPKVGHEERVAPGVDPRHGPQSAEHSQRLPVPSALPQRHARVVQPKNAGDDRPGRRTPGALLPV